MIICCKVQRFLSKFHYLQSSFFLFWKMFHFIEIMTCAAVNSFIAQSGATEETFQRMNRGWITHDTGICGCEWGGDSNAYIFIPTFFPRSQTLYKVLVTFTSRFDWNNNYSELQGWVGIGISASSKVLPHAHYPIYKWKRGYISQEQGWMFTWRQQPR